MMRATMLALAAAVLAACTGATTPEADADEVKSLPGWSKPLPSKQYSGYLDARGGTRHLHVSRPLLRSCAGCRAVLTEMCRCCEQYYYVESEGNPETDPLTLWLNGASQRILSPLTPPFRF
jgi:hypothetical protein